MTETDLTRFTHLRVKPGTRVRLEDRDTRWLPKGHSDGDAIKEQASAILSDQVKQLAESQEKLWADNRYSLLVILQGIDASGKDGTIAHVASGLNPAGVHVVSFKEPSSEDLDHNYLWRYIKAMPEHGVIGFFNRSYYEEVVVVRVNPDILAHRAMPDYEVNDDFWSQRLDDINAMEHQLVRNGTIVIKLFLHLSKDEQRERLLSRLDEKTKHWKFSIGDLKTRAQWDEYQHAFQEMLTHTSTDWAPWWIIPADQKWAMRPLVAQIICQSVAKLALRYPPLSDQKREELRHARELLNKE